MRRLRFETLEDRRMLSFTPAVPYATSSSPSAVATADFNGDGELDLATTVGYASSNRVSIRLGNGSGGFGAAQEFAAPLTEYASSIFTADLNNDARPDVVVSDINGYSTLIGSGNGAFQPAVYAYGTSMVYVGHFHPGSNAVLGLGIWLDGDWATHVQVYWGNGQGGLVAAGQDGYYWGYGGMAPVDLNNDGRVDVVTGEGSVFIGESWGLRFDWDHAGSLGGGAVATGDFTGDGNADVILVYNDVAVLRGRGDGTLDEPVHHSANGTALTAVATADFNADGKLDVVVTSSDTGTVSLLLGNGDGTLHYAGAFATGSLPLGVVVGDFNGDGRPDLAVLNRGSNNVSVLLNDGVWQAAPELIGDYNQDQRVDAADYVVWRKFQGSTVTASTNADGNGDGTVDEGDYGEWREHFGQTRPPAAGSGESVAAESDLSSLQGSDTTEAVETREASEKQGAKTAGEGMFVELAAPRGSRAEKRYTLRREPVAAAGIGESGRDSALMTWLSQSATDQSMAAWPETRMADFGEFSDGSDSLLESVDRYFAGQGSIIRCSQVSLSITSLMNIC